MKKIISTILLICILGMTACSAKKIDVDADVEKILKSFGENDVVPAEYDRVTDTVKGVMPNYTHEFPFSVAYTECDACVVVKIIEYLGDAVPIIPNPFNDDDPERTGFKAKVITSYRGELKSGDEIYIVQHGNEKTGVLMNYPLFKLGTVYALNLSLSSVEYNADYKNYYIHSQFFTTIELVNYENELYAINHGSLRFSIEDLELTPVSKDLYDKISKYYLEADEANEKHSIENIYLAKDLITKISEME